jgi:hypothetical protein
MITISWHSPDSFTLTALVPMPDDLHEGEIDGGDKKFKSLAECFAWRTEMYLRKKYAILNCFQAEFTLLYAKPTTQRDNGATPHDGDSWWLVSMGAVMMHPTNEDGDD